jgi:hypothetical protein
MHGQPKRGYVQPRLEHGLFGKQKELEKKQGSYERSTPPEIFPILREFSISEVFFHPTKKQNTGEVFFFSPK